ncbi:MAG: hypothetical protein HQK52_23075 [Oligoflexia bacterium]|nr:hypothetical protein [Oligoflexia bacterium]
MNKKRYEYKKDVISSPKLRSIEPFQEFFQERNDNIPPKEVIPVDGKNKAKIVVLGQDPVTDDGKCASVVLNWDKDTPGGKIVPGEIRELLLRHDHNLYITDFFNEALVWPPSCLGLRDGEHDKKKKYNKNILNERQYFKHRFREKLLEYYKEYYQKEDAQQRIAALENNDIGIEGVLQPFAENCLEILAEKFKEIDEGTPVVILSGSVCRMLYSLLENAPKKQIRQDWQQKRWEQEMFSYEWNISGKKFHFFLGVQTRSVCKGNVYQRKMSDFVQAISRRLKS